MKLDHYFFHVSKSSEDQKKGLDGKFKEFLSPKPSEHQQKEKKSLHRESKVFVPETPVQTKKKSKDHPALSCRPQSNYWRHANADHSQIIGEKQSNYWGIYPSHPPLPGFWYPWSVGLQFDAVIVQTGLRKIQARFITFCTNLRRHKKCNRPRQKFGANFQTRGTNQKS